MDCLLIAEDGTRLNRNDSSFKRLNNITDLHQVCRIFIWIFYVSSAFWLTLALSYYCFIIY